jgi:tetratricopeptide (TPR) repeat protein
MGFVRDYGWGYVAAFGGLALVLVVGSALMPQAAAQQGTSIPPDRVVAQLQVAGGAYPQSLRDAMAAHRAAPMDLAKAQIAARALIDEGRNRGDSRLVGASVGVLRPFLSDPSPETLYLAATARQYQHDFVGALDLLDQALALSPDDVNARLSRATILTVRGDYAAARDDCQRITGQRRPDIGFLCHATTEILTANGPVYATRLQEILQQPGLLDPQLHGWAMGLIAEVAIHQGDRKLALAQLQAVLAANPLALRERVMLADLLLEADQPSAVLDLLASAPDTDGVLIRRALSARAMDSGAEDARLTAILDKRFKLNLDLGLTAHAREEALYFLTVANDPAQALARAQVNWALQHEVEDALLLLQAAAAAGQPQAGQPVVDWMAQNAVLPKAK